jgi:hypothetical protein
MESVEIDGVHMENGGQELGVDKSPHTQAQFVNGPSNYKPGKEF